MNPRTQGVGAVVQDVGHYFLHRLIGRFLLVQQQTHHVLIALLRADVIPVLIRLVKEAHVGLEAVDIRAGGMLHAGEAFAQAGTNIVGYDQVFSGINAVGIC